MALEYTNGVGEGSGNGADERRARAARRREMVPNLAKVLEKTPPHSLQAEMALLGSMILDPRVIPDVMAIVRTKHDFYSAAHAEIFQAILDVQDRPMGEHLDLVPVVQLLRDRGVLEAIGGEDYLARLFEGVSSPATMPHYAGIVAEKARLRRLIEAAGEMLLDAFEPATAGPEGARSVVDKAGEAILRIAVEDQTSEPESIHDLVQKEVERIESEAGRGRTGLATGYVELDEMLRGLQPGEMIVIAARPSMGKTALALNIAEQLSLGGIPAGGGTPANPVPTAFFSLEMSRSQVALRLLSAASGVDAQHLRGGHKPSNADFTRLTFAVDALRDAPLFVDDTPSLTILALRSRARRMFQRFGIRAIMIDYLQLLTSPAVSRESRQVEVSAISRGIKALARELSVPVVCLAQLNRQAELRDGNRPRMSDLRESGSIEQDADVIILLHRESYYHDEAWREENPDKANIAELIVAKQRNGPTGTVKLVWDPRVTRFFNRDPRARDSDHDGPGSAHWNSYESPAEAAKPVPPPTARGGFAVRQSTGPIDGHRDGGGPDSEDDGGAPF